MRYIEFVTNSGEFDVAGVRGDADEFEAVRMFAQDAKGATSD
jgi:hypothetical protein